MRPGFLLLGRTSLLWQQAGKKTQTEELIIKMETDVACQQQACSPLVVDLLQRIIGVSDALSVMEGLPGQTKGERAIWFSCSLQIKEAVAEVLPNWDDILKAAHEANA